LIVAHLECPDIVNLLRGSVAGAAGALLPRQCSSRPKFMASEGTVVGEIQPAISE
jgi:hypothetical protein